MKKAFSLLELVFSIIILGIIFTGFIPIYIQIQRNHQSLFLNQKLFELERKIFNKDYSEQKTILLRIQDLGDIKFIQKSSSDSVFTLKTLSINDQNYTSEFKDENSF
ncbi:type II secretion system protein [Campylobacter sp. US33a]|uniref:Type II secretion system protein n=1 Tax=Campylobacter sp. CCS1377 TaxID=3158229 RepID=A0AAU7E5J7_9BACT|nr:type II secretion system protein [Campylobacter sp. US33a]TEY03531.1 type II secretion system protein [Campylobacter sp. US33a]